MKIPKKYHHLATDSSVDVDPDGTLVLWLNYGYAFDAWEESHVRCYDTWKDLVKDLQYVELCNCKSCSEHGRGDPVALKASEK
jgi:hypothetical protein